MKKIAIYTALTGNYDSLKDPVVIDPRCDYICFTNQIPSHESVWKYRGIPVNIKNLALLSRYPKMHPHTLLGEYEYSVYMDANIQIVNSDFYQRIFAKIEKEISLSGIKHPFRDCPYNEGYAVFTYGLDSFFAIIRTLRFLKKENFPKHYGMFEANVILRKHSDKKIQKQCEDWWDLINHYSKRDQLTYSYTLWKNHIAFDHLIPENESARNYSGFSFTPHTRKMNIWGGKLKRIGKKLFSLLLTI